MRKHLGAPIFLCSLLSTLALAACGSDTVLQAPASTSTSGAGAGGAGGETTVSTSVGTGGAGGVGLPDLPTGITEIDGTDYNLPTDDLAPFGAAFGEIPVLGLGESVHTSGGYYAMKARLIRYLIQEKGYRVFAIENPRSETFSVGDYVATCEGTSIAAMEGLFGVWASIDMMLLIEWMCAWNQQHPNDTVKYVGFDAQQPWKDIAEIEAFLTAADPAAAPSLRAAIDTCNGVDAVDAADYYAHYYNSAYAYEDYSACLNGLAAMDLYLSTNEPAIVAQVGADALELGRIAIVSLTSWQDEIYYSNTDVPASYEARDLAMGAILLRTRDLLFPNEKTIVWAHNYHLTQAHAGVYTPGIGTALTMGTALKQSLGDDYAAVALIGYDVGINWPGVGTGSQGVAPEGSIEALLHGLQRPYLFVNFDTVFISDFIDLGTAYSMGYPVTEKVRPEEQYRGAFFLDVSPGMDAVFW